MAGALITFAACACFAGLGRGMGSRLLAGLDPAAAWGLSGLFGLAVLGWMTLPIGLLPGGLQWGLFFVLALAIVGLVLLARLSQTEPVIRFSVRNRKDWLFIAAFALAAGAALAGALGPSDSSDWDSLAYHLAVPKLWLNAGRIEFVPFIHHSNFPFLVDNLFVWGLAWGGQAGAKAFAWAYAGFGGLALFGLARARYGQRAGWWSALAFVAIPTVLWESGTAYVDVAHGLWAGMGVLFAAEYFENPSRRSLLSLCALCLGFACASKYTGLQVLACVGAMLLVGSAIQKRWVEGVRDAGLTAVVALLLCSPWLLRNVANTGNPVYPFFFEVFGGRNWDQERAEIYRREQQTFGVGRRDADLDWFQLPHAVLGLAYQPGRYVNPGQTEGLGMPTGAMGAVAIAALLVWPLSGRARRFESATLVILGLCFALWFAMSQQSRYALNMGVPLCVLAGGAVLRLSVGPLLAGLTVLQAAYAVWLAKVFHVEPKLPVLLGTQTESQYLERAVPFSVAARKMNGDPGVRKVALYDEVFGFLLEKPYFWANPGHSTAIPYERMESGRALAEALGAQGFTHVYVNFAYMPRADAERWLAASGVSVWPARFYGPEERSALMSSLEQRWKPLLAEAVAARLVVPEVSFGKSVLFSIPR